MILLSGLLVLFSHHHFSSVQTFLSLKGRLLPGFDIQHFDIKVTIFLLCLQVNALWQAAAAVSLPPNCCSPFSLFCVSSYVWKAQAAAVKRRVPDEVLVRHPQTTRVFQPLPL